MIDYVKILLSNIDIQHLVNLLNFKREINQITGEYSTKRIAEYHFCKITIYDSGIVLFTGSIHKLFNSLKDLKAPNYKEEKTYKGYNGNQFTINNILEVREHLQNLFSCKPQQMVFQNIEFGVNSTPIFNPNFYLKGLLYHKNKPFEFSHDGNFSQAVHKHFIFKLYNKSIQYGMSEFTLRIELKIIKTVELKGINIKTFADVNSNSLKKVKKLLLTRFDEVMHYDYTINKKGLTKRETQLLESYSNPRYWIIDLKSNHRDRHKKKLHQLTVKHSKNLHQQLRNDIRKSV